MRTFAFILFCGLVSTTGLAEEFHLPRSTYSPPFRDSEERDIEIGPLKVDSTPVTNQDFLDFVKVNPQYAKSKIQALFADSGYLARWKNDGVFEPNEARYPVTNISWFVARRYCEAQGKRLPTIAEWEVASEAQTPLSETQILNWYGNPTSPLRRVGVEGPNKYGMKDAHGLIWEWVENFSETIMSGDSRGGSSTDSLFCGGAALKAKDPRLYATFIRFAFRSSLTAKYTSSNLGFRCVKDIGGDLN